MKTLKNIFAALVLVSFATVSVSAQTNPTASAQAASSATIITPIGITKVGDLAFGNIIASASLGTVVVALDGTRSQTGGATFPSIAGTISAASFTVSGMTGVGFTLTLPENNVIELSAGEEKMTLSAFTHNAPSVIASGGSTFQVGATLNVKANQGPGAYTGSFNAIVNYN